MGNLQSYKRIMAFDPGGTTGVAYQEGNGKVGSFIIDTSPLVEVHEALNIFEPELVVYERFDYRPHQKSADLMPVEVIGVIKLWCIYNSVGMYPQQQLKKDKGFWTDDKLKYLELYRKGEHGHSNDAMRQLLHHLTFTERDDRYVSLLK